MAAAVRLAIAVSTIAAALAIGLELIGDVSRPAFIACVTVVGFAVSWVQTGRTVQSVQRHRRSLIALPVDHR